MAGVPESSSRLAGVAAHSPLHWLRSRFGLGYGSLAASLKLRVWQAWNFLVLLGRSSLPPSMRRKPEALKCFVGENPEP